MLLKLHPNAPRGDLVLNAELTPDLMLTERFLRLWTGAVCFQLMWVFLHVG